MTSRLHTKLVRDLGANRWQFLAVSGVVALGVAMYVAGLSSYHNLFESYRTSYARLRFADAWIACDRAPVETVRHLARMPGIACCEGRVNVESPVRLPGKEERNVVGRFIGMPTRQRPQLNDVRVIRGRYLSRQPKREALLEAGFARAQKIVVGDVITVDVEGSLHDFRVVGLVQTPEYIVAVRDEQYSMPTPSTFGVIFVPEEEAREVFDLVGHITEVCLKLKQTSECLPGNVGSPVRVPAAVRQAHAILKPYGAQDPTMQDEQPSHRLLRMDLESIRQLAVIFPSLFLIAAALTIYVLLLRIVHSQRPHIGFLRASGFTQGVVVCHYLGFACTVGLVGGMVGVALGNYLAHIITQEYVTTLNIPCLAARVHWDTIAIGVSVSLLICVAGGFVPAWTAGKLPPAVAMRDEAPPFTDKSRALPAFARLPYSLRVPMRNLFRSRRRTLSTATGIASGVSLVLVSAMFLDAIDYAISSYFGKMQRYDMLVQFLPAQNAAVQYHLSLRPGVRRVEPGLALPVVLEKNGRKFSTILLGLPAKGTLYRVLDASGNPTELLDSSLRVGNLIRRRLGIETGDHVLVRYAFSSRDVTAEAYLRVGPRIEQPATTLVYANIDTVRQSFGSALDLPQRPVSALALSANARHTEALRHYLLNLPHAAAVEVTSETRAELDRMMEFTYVFITVMLLFGAGLAFAIVFNTLSINVIERTREIAALRTLGFRHSQIVLMTTLENLLVALLGLGFGFPLGRLLCHWLIRAYQSETVDLQVILYPRTYILTGIGMALTVLLAQIPSLHGIRHLDLAKATKERAG